jgi:hypothetical protein
MRMWFYAGGFLGGFTFAFTLVGVVTGAPWPYVALMVAISAGTFWHSRCVAKELAAG